MRMYRQGVVNYFPGQINLNVGRITHGLKFTVVDSGFPRGANPRGGCANLLFGNFFAEDCFENERNLTYSLLPFVALFGILHVIAKFKNETIDSIYIFRNHIL